MTVRYITRRDVSTLLRVTERTVDRMARDGRLPRPKRLGTGPRARVRFKQDDVERRLNQGGEG